MASVLVSGVVSGPLAPSVAYASDVTPPPPPPPPDQPIVGFADTHLHEFSNLGFGGLEIWGSPVDPALDPGADQETARSRALPDSDYLYVSDAAVDDIVGALGVGARSNPTTTSCTANCSPKCPPGAGTPANPCWKVAIHGDGGSLDLLNKALGGDTDGHGTMGYPNLDGWPAWDVLTVQQAYYEWLQRARDHGLKLMVMLAVNNATICSIGYHLNSYGCDDTSAVERQIQGAKNLETYIDARSGGPGQGFYKIVYSGDGARQAIAEGKLAVVLGAEVPTLWGCKVHNDLCTGDYIRDKVLAYFNMGIRHIFPIHVADNRFGGAALYNSIFDFNNLIVNGDFNLPPRLEFFEATTVCDASLEFRLSLRDKITRVIKPLVATALATFGILGPAIIPILIPIVAPILAADPAIGLLLPLLGPFISTVAASLFALLPLAALVFLVPDAPGDPRTAPDPPAPNCNTRTLTTEGEALVNALMDHGMIIDVDHTDARTFGRILDIAEARHYAGIVSGHTGLVSTGLTRAESEALFPDVDFNLEDSARHEGNKTDAQIARIRNLGGVVSLILHQGGLDRIREFVPAGGGLPPVPFDCGNSSQAWAQVYLYATKTLGLTAVAIGSDMNGLAGMPAPRFGPEACGGSHGPGYSPTQMIDYSHPFMDYFGGSVDRYQFGNRTWDYNYDGVSNVGLYPDFIQDLQVDGLSHTDLGPLFNSAEAYVKMWEKVNDHDAPSVACGTVGEDWHAADVTVPCVAWDTGAGLAVPSDRTFTLSTTVPAGTETGNASTGTHPPICDQAGNCTGTVAAVTGINVDKKPPVVSITEPVSGATYTLNETRHANYGCTDGGSGVDSCIGTVANGAAIDATIGSHSFTVAAKDRVGNSASATVSYNVTYRICLLYDPTKPTGSPNSTVPIKLRLCDANNANVSSATIVLTAIGLDGQPPGANFSGSSNLGYVFRFDSSILGYIYNANTKGLARGVHTFTFSASGDPVTHTVTFLLK